jgi:hypothetical protein
MWTKIIPETVTKMNAMLILFQPRAVSLFRFSELDLLPWLMVFLVPPDSEITPK